ncbi:hypothetical protein VKT23_013445 [Stygiomarasmius scandens]|uniref:Acid phosphatase n=1 Tax=Marasmiellus scandens TaxID=2682957 RepID=A0ABR1J3T9_9AGAR
MILFRNAAFFACLARLSLAASLADVEHVVLFMQENRAFDHYFGTMAGVRGFRDPNVQINPDGRSTFFQLVDSRLSNATDHLLPFYLNEAGGEFVNGTQCMVAGSNSWGANQAALASGQNNMWAIGNSPYSIGYFKRQDLPVHFAVADAWTVGDMYQEVRCLVLNSEVAPYLISDAGRYCINGS